MADPHIAEMILENTYKVKSKYSGPLRIIEVQIYSPLGMNFKIEVHEICGTISSFRAN